MLLKLIKLLPYPAFIVGIVAVIKSLYFSTSQDLLIYGILSITFSLLLFAVTRNMKELNLRVIK